MTLTSATTASLVDCLAHVCLTQVFRCLRLEEILAVEADRVWMSSPSPGSCLGEQSTPAETSSPPVLQGRSQVLCQPLGSHSPGCLWGSCSAGVAGCAPGAAWHLLIAETRQQRFRERSPTFQVRAASCCPFSGSPTETALQEYFF